MTKFFSRFKFPRYPSLVMLLLLVIPLVTNDMQPHWKHFENSLLQYGLLALPLASLPFVVMRFSGTYYIRVTSLDVVFTLLCIYILFNTNAELFTFWNQKLARVLFLLAVFLLLRIVWRDSDAENTLWVCLFVIGIGNCIFGFTQYATHYGTRNAISTVTGTFNNSGIFSCYLAASLPAAYFILTARLVQRKFIKTITIIFISGCVLLLITSLSRAALISAVAGAVYFVTKRSTVISGRKVILLIIPIIVATLSLLFYFIRTSSADGRLLIWKVSLCMWQQNPVTGIGNGQFAYQYNNHQADFFRQNNEPAFEVLASNTYYAFNEYLEMLVENGIPGLLLLLVVAAMALGKFRPPSGKSDSLITSQTIILTLLVFGLFSYPLSSTAISTILVICLSLLSHYSKNVAEFSLNYRTGNLLMAALLIGVAALLIAGKKRYDAITEWKAAAELMTYERTSEALDKYRKVYPLLKYHGAYLYNYGAVLYELGEYEESLTILKEASKFFSHIDLHIFLGKNYENLADYKNAEQSYKHASLMIPNRFIPKYLLVKLYAQQKDYLKATELAKQIVTMPVKVNSRTVTQIKKEMQLFIDGQSTSL